MSKKYNTNDYQSLDDYYNKNQSIITYNIIKFENTHRIQYFLLGNITNLIPDSYIHEINNKFTEIGLLEIDL